ncbi:hypothetical protein [Flagellimonas meridianipacifica]|uniref:Class I SAM-dependent methyltransferase n=1 Tax=Flagellimonas meridianipacifica TaxID=1080225 RepID=A0A2T0MFV0_9FLAO|nr:hypothetical protein [Allomuricauda pacifica]PRX56467.1 hypothetical protein CLV81_0464 [Allomuricauda pacifica]
MKRLQLFEFEDFDWLPLDLRSGATNLIKVLHRLVGTSEVLSNLILSVREKVDFNQIVDLGSGSGGPMIETIWKINEERQDSQVNLLLTDLYPNTKTIADINALNLSNVSYHPESLDAQKMDTAPEGLKTMIASFHHMRPSIAKQILDKAEHSGEPLLIYEIAKNNVPILIWWILLPISLIILVIMSLCMTLFVRPLRAKQLLFTYLIPLIPIIYAWDGQASLMRTYTFKDVEELLGERKNEKYVWEISDAKKRNGKNAGYYILGYPVK